SHIWNYGVEYKRITGGYVWFCLTGTSCESKNLRGAPVEISLPRLEGNITSNANHLLNSHKVSPYRGKSRRRRGIG
ncbi:unnamed protein product, partial [Discosporangium mesarthrocarpum]